MDYPEKTCPIERLVMYRDLILRMHGGMGWNDEASA